MRGFLVVACTLTLLAIVPAAQADVTIGSTLPPPNGGLEGCASGCTRSLTAIAGQAVTAPYDGVVTRWRIRAAGAVAPVRFVIVRRPTGPGNTPGELAGRSDEVTPDPDEVSRFDVQMPIRTGEYIGIEWTANADYFANTAGSTSDTWTPPLGAGQSRPPEFPNDREALVSADIEPDVDGDGFGDTTQDSDDDNDGLADETDMCPRHVGPAPQGCPLSPVVRINQPPVVRFRTPASGTAVRAAQTIELDVADDAGNPTVTVFDDDGQVCALTAPPYTCTWTPTGADVGRATLLASAVDSDNRSTLGIVRVRVARFTADLTRRVRGRRVTGRLVLPAAVERALGCRGEVTVRRGRRAQTVALKRNCTYSARVRGRGRVRARFAGNPVVEPAT